jgi:hypothetical protein
LPDAWDHHTRSPAIAPQHAVVVPDIPDALIDVSESAVQDIGLMYLAKLEQRSSGEASIERDVIGFGEPDEREE